MNQPDSSALTTAVWLEAESGPSILPLPEESSREISYLPRREWLFDFRPSKRREGDSIAEGDFFNEPS